VPGTTDLAALRPRVQHAVDAHLDAQEQVLADLGDELAPLLRAVRSLLTGGKRLRAGFLYWGYRAAGGPDGPGPVRLAASMEYFQAAALLHDDVMDRSDTRRGMPAAHRAIEALHGQQGWLGDGERFGEGAAILAGDLCLSWSDELFATCGLPVEALDRGRPVFDRMRTQLMAGQYLDLLESVRGWEGMGLDERIASARKVIRYKSAKYTIEHPLLIGASVAGVGDRAADGLSRYGLALGEAFQLRDDLLGVFGDPGETGKPAGDDLREGKRTVLVAYGLDGADPAGRDLLEGALGRADLDDGEVERVRDVLTSSGAVDRVEGLIASLTTTAATALEEAGSAGPLDPEGTRALAELIGIATARRS
jgi:geranylgeranyl diphosphate synthase type I